MLLNLKPHMHTLDISYIMEFSEFGLAQPVLQMRKHFKEICKDYINSGRVGLGNNFPNVLFIVNSIWLTRCFPPKFIWQHWLSSDPFCWESCYQHYYARCS